MNKELDALSKEYMSCFYFECICSFSFYCGGEEYTVKESSITVTDSDTLVRYYNTDGEYLGNELYLSKESANELGIYSELKH